MAAGVNDPAGRYVRSEGRIIVDEKELGAFDQSWSW